MSSGEQSVRRILAEPRSPRKTALQSDVCKLDVAFAARTAHAVDARAIAAAMAGAWRAIGNALSPVIGANGSAALVTRCVHLAAQQHLWLLDTCGDGHQQTDTAALTAEMTAGMAMRSVDEAAAAAQCLLHTFETLLASLVGESLAAQLLRPVFEKSWGDAPVEGRTS